MAGSRWVDSEEDAAFEAKKKLEREEKKRQKAEKAAKAAEAEKLAQKVAKSNVKRGIESSSSQRGHSTDAKRQKLDSEQQAEPKQTPARRTLRFDAPTWDSCRSIEEYETLNAIEEGSYGWVSRGKQKKTGQIVALKKLKMDGSDVSGFPITGLREIQCLMACHHENVVNLQCVATGPSLDEYYLVMDFLEHDLKTLMEEMREPFLASEIKTVMSQLAGAVAYLHDHWIIHRDLKASNILINNRGTIKIADFGMARFYSSPPPPNLTTLVVTLWYRAPEVLFGKKDYGFPIDIWSLGCIFAELLTNEPLLPGKNEVNQITKIFEVFGVPTEESWPGFRQLPITKGFKLPGHKGKNTLKSRFPSLTKVGIGLLEDMLEMNPDYRPTASQVLKDPWFKEAPRPKSRELFPTFPSKAGGERRRKYASPSAPPRGQAPTLGNADFSHLFDGAENSIKAAGSQLKP